MASLAPKKLHFYSTVENEHLTETPVESVNCKFVTLPTLSVPSYNYIKLNFSSTRELQFLINQNSGHIDASVVPPSLKGEIVVDYGNGERDVYETTYEPAANNDYKISEGSINSIKIFPYDEPRVVTLWGDIHGLQVKGPNFTTGGTNTTAYRVTNAEINGMSSLLDTGYMLKDHSLLTSVDLSSFDSSNLENVGGMFMNCTSLETVNLSGFNTSNLKSLYALFYACTKLKTIINIENINTSSVINLQSLFWNCGELTSLDLSKWDVSKVTHMNSMFAYCGNLTSVNLSNWITTSLKSVGSMFLSCRKLTNVNINHFRITEGNTASFGSNTFEMMFKHCQELTSINLNDWNSITTRSLEQMFSGCTKLTTITLPVKGITTTSFWSTFNGCSVLTTINNLDKINTREVMIFENMFAGCQNITSLDLSNFDTRSALVMSGMFSMCKKLQTLSGVENWNTKTLMYAKQMFYDTPQINNISFEKWCTPDVIAHSSFRTDSALQSEPTWSEPYCEFCCPLVEHDGVRFVFSNLNRTPDQHSTYKVNGSPTHTGYEMLPTTGTETVSEYKTLIEETDTTILEYSGFDEGGKLCAIVVPYGTYTLDEVSGINDSETFKNVSLNGNVVGKIRKLINNTEDGKNTIFYTTDKSTCYEGEYGSGDTIILSPFVAPTPSPTPTPLPTPTPIPDCRPKQPRDVSCTDVALHIQSNGDDPILDSSKNNAKITKYGDVKNSTEKTILESESSLYFDGNGDYLEIDQEAIKSEIYDIGNDDFTIEFWFNSKSLATRQGILSTNHADAETENDAKYDALFIGLEDRSVTYNELANNGTNHNTIFVMFRRDDMTTKFKYLSKKIEANTWYHFALVRENNLLNTFLNGEAIDNQYSYSSNNYDRYMTGGILKNGYDGEKLNLLVGKFGLHYFNGYIQDLRITRKAVYENTCVVIPSSLFDTNAVGSTSEPLCSEIQLHIKSDTVNESDFIFDDSDYNNQITMVGNVHHETDEPFIGKSSIYFDGNGDHLDIGDTSTFKFLHDKTTDFTIEGWVYANSVSPHTTLFTTNGGTSANVGCSAIIYPDGGIYFETYRGVSETRGIHYGGGNKTLFKFSAWNHVVITFSKSEDKVEIYVNGIEIEGSAGHGANSPSLANSNIPLTIGRYPTNSTNLNGYIQNFRISKKKVYTGCFALPRDFTSLCDPTPTPTSNPTPTPVAQQDPTPTPTEEANLGGDEQTPTPTKVQEIIQGNTLSGLNEVEGNGTYSKLSHDGKTLIVFHPGKVIVSAKPTLYVYEQLETGWIERASSVVEETTAMMLDGGHRWFPDLLAITPTADKIVVGLPGIDKVKVYSFTNNNLVQIGDDITADDLDTYYREKFGHGVAISQDGSIVGVGGPTFYHPNNTIRGYHRVFEYKNDNWTKKGTRVKLSNSSNDGMYGTGIDFNSDATEMVVAHGGGKIISWNWSETDSDYIRTNFDIDLAPTSSHYGVSPPSLDLTSDGKTIAVSYPIKSIVRVYTRTNASSEWTQKGQNISTFQSGSRAGVIHVSISEDGSILAVGDNKVRWSPPEPGWVRIFKWINDEWVQLGDTIVRDPNDQAEGHVHLSGDGSTFVVGSRTNTNVTIYNVNTFSDTLASTTSTAEAVAGTKVIEIPDSDTSKFSANMEIVIAPDDDTKREENVIDSIGSLILKNELQNTHPVGTRIVEKATSNNEDDPTPTPEQTPTPLETRKFYVNGDPNDYDTYQMIYGYAIDNLYQWASEYREISDQDTPSLAVFNIENSNGNTIYIDYVKDMETIPIRLAEIDNFGRIIYSDGAISNGIHYTISFTDIHVFYAGTEDEELAIREITLTKVVENTPTPTNAGDDSFECPAGKIAEWQLPNGDPCDPSQATLKTFFGLSMNLNNEWENVFDGLTIKFGEQETANGVDYLPIYAKVDNNKITLSSGNNVSEWNRLYLFVGDNKNPNNQAVGEGIEFDTIVRDDNDLNEVNTISAKIPFRFASINGINTLQIKNILKPTNPAFTNRNVESDWSSVYVGPGYDLNDDVWPSASVDVNYEIGPITYSSIDCNQVCVDAQTPTPTTANYFAEEETNCVLFKDQGNWFGTNHNICFDLNTNEVRFADLKLIDENIPSDFTGNDTDVQYAIVKKDALEYITDLIELEDMMYDSMATFASSSNLFIRNSYSAGADSPSLYSANSYLNANHNLQYTIYGFTNGDNPNYLTWKGNSEVVLIMFYGDFKGTAYGPETRRILGKVEFAEV